MRTPLLLLATAVTAAAAVATIPAASAAPAVSHHAARHTARVVVRPVHANGTPVAGWTVTRSPKIAGFTCNEGPSPVAVDDGIRFCGFSATYTVACWKSKNHTVLCLRDPQSTTLARIRYSGRFRAVTAPKHPSPQALRLYRGGSCLIRDGGAWSRVTGHPKWFGDDSCTNGTAVYGPGRDGINRTHQPWTVHQVRNAGVRHQHIVTRQVRTAYYVGTAS